MENTDYHFKKSIECGQPKIKIKIFQIFEKLTGNTLFL